MSLRIFLPLAPDPCENSKGMDVAFIVDKTKSLGVANFLLLKGFLLEVVDAMNIGPNATHTAIMTFSKKAKVLSTFADKQFYSSDAVHQLIDEMPITLGEGTFIDKALITANKTLFTEKGGDRPNYPNVLILFTDGMTNPKSQPLSQITPLLKVSVEILYSLDYIGANVRGMESKYFVMLKESLKEKQQLLNFVQKC